MEKEELKFYINDKKVKLNKKKTYRRNVKISFKGKAMLINNKLHDNDINKRIEITDGHVINKNGNYTIVYTVQEKIYYIDFEVKKRHIFVLLLLMLPLFAVVLIKLNDENITLQRKFDIGVGINNYEQTEDRKYMFKVNARGYKNSNFQRILIADTVDKNKITKETIAPGTHGNFDIIIDNYNSNVDVEYSFNIVEQTIKPKNLYFIVANNRYRTLEELANKELTGTIEKNKVKIISIEWYWDYEGSDESDYIDTMDAINITNYSFEMIAIGKEIYADNN